MRPCWKGPRAPNSGPLRPRISPETCLERRDRRLPSESGVKLGIREVRYKSRRKIRLQVLVKELHLVRLGLPDLDDAHPADGTRTSRVRDEAVRGTQQRHQRLQHQGIGLLVHIRLFGNHEHSHRCGLLRSVLGGGVRRCSSPSTTALGRKSRRAYRKSWPPSGDLRMMPNWWSYWLWMWTANGAGDSRGSWICAVRHAGASRAR